MVSAPTLTLLWQVEQVPVIGPSVGAATEITLLKPATPSMVKVRVSKIVSPRLIESCEAFGALVQPSYSVKENGIANCGTFGTPARARFTGPPSAGGVVRLPAC